MTIGTEGPDVLTSDGSENVKALGGDDIINLIVVRGPNVAPLGLSVDGGAGNDTLNISATYVRSLGSNSAYLAGSTTSGGTVVQFYEIERVVVSAFFSPGTYFTGNTIDKIHVLGTLNQAGITLFTQGGDDEIRLGNVGQGSSVFAGIGADLVDLSGFQSTGAQAFGEEGNDVLIGSPSGDRLDGGAGADAMTGGAGNDTYVVDDAGDSVTEAPGGGIDSVETSLAAYTLGDGLENLSVLPTAGGPHDFTLNAADNRVTGGSGPDFMRLQQGGADTAFGQDGNDVFYFGPAFTSADQVDGGAGIDQLALRGDYTIAFGAGQLVGIEQIGLVSAFDTRFGALDDPYEYNLTMNDSNVAAGLQTTVDAAPLRPGESLTFIGSAETDGSFRIFGGQGNDLILGGQSGDVIVGGPGRDTLFGNAGNDVFRYNAASDSTPAAQDLIRDFALGDLLDLSRIDADALTAGNQAFSFIGSGAFGHHAGELRVEDQRNPIWLVQGDTDGDGVADFELLLFIVDRHAPTSGDFVL